MPRDGSGDVKRTYIEVEMVMRKGVLRGDVDLNKRGDFQGNGSGLERNEVAGKERFLKSNMLLRGIVRVR